MPFGQPRFNNTPVTDFAYTGQRDLDLQGNLSLGLMDYNARFYDSRIMEFQQPDTLVSEPYNPQTLNRYAYAQDNPIRYNDPSGHCIEDLCIGEIFLAVAALVAAAPEIDDFVSTEGPEIEDTVSTTVENAGPAIEQAVAEGEQVTGQVAGDVESTVNGAVSSIADTLNTSESTPSTGSIVRMLDPYDETVQIGAKTVTDNPLVQNAYNVVGHGDPFSMEGIDGASVSADDLAGMIKSDPEYEPGTPICLVSCSTGADPNGFAQQLANKMQTEVYAADDEVSSTTLKVFAGGSWNWFKPEAIGE